MSSSLDTLATQPHPLTLADVFSLDAAWELWSYYVSRIAAVFAFAGLLCWLLRTLGLIEDRGLFDCRSSQARARAEVRRIREEEEEEGDSDDDLRGRLELTMNRNKLAGVGIGMLGGSPYFRLINVR